MLTLDEIDGSLRESVETVISGLEDGKLRVAEPDGKGGWKIIPLCPFMKAQMDRHPDWNDVRQG